MSESKVELDETRIAEAGSPAGMDDLFALSLQAPTVFQNFSGTFDGNGDATLKVVIPADQALLGISFHTAWVFGKNYDAVQLRLSIAL